MKHLGGVQFHFYDTTPSKDMKEFQEVLRKTLKRLHENGQGGRLSSTSTALVLAKLIEFILQGKLLPSPMLPLIPSTLVKLQSNFADLDCLFGPEEIEVFLNIYDLTPEDNEEPTEETIITKTLVHSNMIYDMIGMALKVNSFLEEVLEALEELSWKDFDAQARMSQRNAILSAFVCFDTLPRRILLLSFHLLPAVNIQEPCKVPGEYTTEMLAAKVSVASAVPMGNETTLLLWMATGIDRMIDMQAEILKSSDQKDLAMQNLREIRDRQRDTIIDLQKINSSQQASISELEMALTNSKEAWQRTKEEFAMLKDEHRNLQTRQEKEGDAIFNSLNLKISERDAQLEVANTRIKDLEKELRRAETKGAKETKKEQAKAAVSYSARMFLV